MKNSLNVVIVDDELKSCQILKNMLTEFVDPSINVIGVANNTLSAEKLISEFSPDAVFLDIEMPKENAFQFLNRMTPINFEVVFITAYDNYAIRAFRLNAIDYILKPISVYELRTAVEKLKNKIRSLRLINEMSISYSDISSQLLNRRKSNKIILKKDTNNSEILEFKDICFIEAQRSYSRIQFLKNNALSEIVMSSPLADYEELLPDDLFFRIHKSYLINCTHIAKISNNEDGCFVEICNLTLPVSRRRHSLFVEFRKNNGFK